MAHFSTSKMSLPSMCLLLWMQKCLGQTAPSGSLSLSQLSQWQPSSRWPKVSQTSGTVASQSDSLSQSSTALNKFSTLASAASPGHFISMQEESGRYSGLSSWSQSTTSQYNSGFHQSAQTSNVSSFLPAPDPSPVQAPALDYAPVPALESAFQCLLHVIEIIQFSSHSQERRSQSQRIQSFSHGQECHSQSQSFSHGQECHSQSQSFSHGRECHS